MNTFLEALIARSFISTPSAIRPRPVARFEVADPDGPHEETPDGVRSKPRVTGPTTAERSADPGGETQAAQPRMRPEPEPAEVYRAPRRRDPMSDAHVVVGTAPAEAPSRSAASPVRELDIAAPQVRREPVMQRAVEQLVDGPLTPILVEKAPPLLGPPRPIQVVATEPVHEDRAPDGQRTERTADPDGAPQVEVEITIGRIELGAPPRPPVTPPRPRTTTLKPAVTLDEYLHRRSGGR